jgi:tRNA dimethylallyltransferase
MSHALPESPDTRPIWIAGPTGVGKSAVALELATRIGGEIVSVDSMQVYRGLDIGTAKPSAADRARVTHHLIDVIDLNERFDAARFAAMAGPAIQAIQDGRRTPILCGGTGFYFRALSTGVGAGPPADPDLRAQLEGTSQEELLRELRESDPASFERIERANRRRVIRAIEVIRLTGRPFSDFTSTSPDVRAGGEAIRGCFLVRSDADLRARIDRRVDTMFATGLVEETRRLLACGLRENAVALQALGYRQVVEHLNGERSLESTVALVKTKTWQFARRQKTWFRHQFHLPWLLLEPDEPVTTTALRLLNELR